VNVCNGDAYGQLYVKEISASGFSDENGTLEVQFIVAENNNISWLSYKNLFYEVAEVPTAIEDVEAVTAGENSSIFNLSGQKLNSLQKGINVVNGKKVLVK
jgi:hypothetical protein